MKTFLIVDGNKAIKAYLDEFKSVMREYKKIYRGWGYTFKKVMPKGATKPYYYWYKWEYDPNTQNNVWTYVGKEKPEVNIPDPPVNRLDEVSYSLAGENVIINEIEYQKIIDIFENYQKFEISPA